MRYTPHALLIVAALCAPAASQITLPDGTVVPKERMIVFLFAGHSNMAGRCTPDDQTTHPRVWAYGASGHRYWQPCKDRIFTNSTGAGPATALLKRFADAYPQYYFCAIQNANSQAGIRWHNGDANNRYWKGAGRYEEMMGYARDLQGKVTFGGVVTMLGIMEATSANSIYWNTFSDDFRTTINNIRSDLGLVANRLPVLFQDYEREACSQFSASNTGPQAIIAQNALIEGKLSNSALVATNGIPCPDQCHHFDLNGMRTWAGRAFTEYTGNNWDFWDVPTDNTPPSVPGNVRIGAKTMTSLLVLWNASTDASGVASYTVSWGSGTKNVAGTATQAVIDNLTPCTSYSLTVKATDTWSNTSAASSAANDQTECCTDNTPPSVPAGLRATSATQTGIALAWNASTDDQAVAGYEIYEGSTLAGSTTGAGTTSHTVSGLTAQTSYTFTVKARDECGNRSAASSPLTTSTAERMVAAIPFKVNLGGSAGNGFAADKEWADGADYGYTGTSRTATVTTAVAGTDIDPIYQSLRYTECDGLPSSTLTFGYRIAVPDGHYVVTLMFAEFWRSSAGGRTFNINLEGQPLPDNPIDIFAAAGSAGAYDISSAVVVTDGVIEIQTGMVVSDPLICGITVVSAEGVEPYTILAPTDGQQFTVGDTLTVEFDAQTGIVRDAHVELSDDAGETWYSLMFDGSLSSSAPEWGTFKVVLPASISGTELGGKDWSLRIRDYDQVYIVEMQGAIRINANSAVGGTIVAAPPRNRPLCSVAGSQLRFCAPASSVLRAEVTMLDGSLVKRMAVAQSQEQALDLSLLGRGVYLVTAHSANSTVVRRLLLH